MLSSKVIVKTSEHYGERHRTLVAAEPLAAGALVWWEDLDTDPPVRTFRRAELMAMSIEQRELLARYSYMLDDDVFSTGSPDEDPAFLFNHSCDPNCGYDTDVRLVTLRDVAAGEELVYDYAMTETEASMHAGMVCQCGSDRCRGVLRFDNWRSRAFADRYRGYLTSYLQAKTQELGWYDTRIHACRLGGGRSGLVAMAPIAAGDVVLVFAGKVVTLAHLLELDPGEVPFTLQVSTGLWQVPVPGRARTEPTDQLNHSCEANCGMLDSTVVVAMRDIVVGEELTLDYGTVNSGEVDLASDTFTCECGAASCRGQVTSADWKLPEVQARYGEYFSPFVRRLLDERRLA